MGLAFVILLVAVVITLKLIGNIFGLLFMLGMSAIVAFGADALIPGKQLGGWLPAAGAGLLGSAIGVHLIGHKGLILLGVPIFPAFLGSLLVVVAVAFFQRSRSS